MSRFARGILVGAMALFVACDPSPSASLRPNILLVSIDSLRADHLGSYGYRRNTSPNIDALAAEGVRFSTAIAPAPWTLPSHLTMLTGRHPAAHGVISEHQKLAEGIPTLAEVLHREGYATAAFVAGPYVSGHFGFDRGFDLYDETLVADGLLASHRTTTSPALVDKVSSWVQGHAETRDHPSSFSSISGMSITTLHHLLPTTGSSIPITRVRSMEGSWTWPWGQGPMRGISNT